MFGLVRQIVHWALYSVDSSLYFVDCIVSTAHCVVYTMHCTLLTAVHWSDRQTDGKMDWPLSDFNNSVTAQEGARKVGVYLQTDNRLTLK